MEANCHGGSEIESAETEDKEEELKWGVKNLVPHGASPAPGLKLITVREIDEERERERERRLHLRLRSLTTSRSLTQTKLRS